MHFVKILTDRLAERSKLAKECQELTLTLGTHKSVVFIGSTSLEHVVDVIESYVLCKQASIIEENVSGQ